MHELTAIYWIKNEVVYLPEWIEFHLIQGFDHFILYDNNSTDNLYEIMQPYLEKEILEIRKYPNPLYPPARSGPPNSKNFWIMDYCIEEQRGKSKWIHYHAVDEFTFMVDGSNIVNFLKNYEDIGALCIEWELFNSNDHVHKPNGLVIENYTMTYPDAKHHIKTMIMPEKAYSTMGNPHNFILLDNHVSVTENRMPLRGPWNFEGPNYDLIRNHHYVTRSRQEFIEKNNKGLLDSTHMENIPRSYVNDGFDSEWNIGNSHPERKKCDELLKYVPAVREAIAKRYYGREHLLEKICH
jgi:hypothetical protein